MATDNASGIMDLRISPSSTSIPQSPWIGRLKAPDKGYFLDPADFGFHGRGPDAASVCAWCKTVRNVPGLPEGEKATRAKYSVRGMTDGELRGGWQHSLSLGI